MQLETPIDKGLHPLVWNVSPAQKYTHFVTGFQSGICESEPQLLTARPSPLRQIGDDGNTHPGFSKMQSRPGPMT
jgi:hypothetical protein